MVRIWNREGKEIQTAFQEEKKNEQRHRRGRVMTWVFVSRRAVEERMKRMVLGC